MSWNARSQLLCDAGTQSFMLAMQLNEESQLQRRSSPYWANPPHGLISTPGEWRGVGEHPRGGPAPPQAKRWRGGGEKGSCQVSVGMLTSRSDQECPSLCPNRLACCFEARILLLRLWRVLAVEDVENNLVSFLRCSTVYKLIIQGRVPDTRLQLSCQPGS